VTSPERSVPPHTFLRDILPYFLDSNVPVMVLDDRGKLLGVVTRGALIGGLATSAQIAEGDGRVPVLAGREREGVRR
jgi:glycine betaine/proline transport system ATP-binding protein